MRITIDRDACISAGECVYNHPELFRFGDDDVPMVLIDEVATPAQRVGVEQAIEVCPSGAIALTP